jgi:hypothetical protein
MIYMNLLTSPPPPPSMRAYVGELGSRSSNFLIFRWGDEENEGSRPSLFWVKKRHCLRKKMSKMIDKQAYASEVKNFEEMPHLNIYFFRSGFTRRLSHWKWFFKITVTEEIMTFKINNSKRIVKVQWLLFEICQLKRWIILWKICFDYCCRWRQLQSSRYLWQSLDLRTWLECSQTAVTAVWELPSQNAMTANLNWLR